MPDFINIETFLKIVLAMIMLSVGLSLTTNDFRYIFRNTRIFLVALVSKMLLFPLLGLLIAHLWGLPPTFQLGIFLLLICPGGTTSNVITYWFSGTTALTISLTTITSFLAVFLIPPLVNWSHRFYLGDGVIVNLPVFETTTNIFYIVIIPVFVGMLFKMYFSKPADVAERILKNVSIVLLGIIYLVKFFASKEHGGAELTQHEIWLLLPVLLAINVAAMVVGYYVPRLFGIGIRDSMTTAIELGLQNLSLALLIGSVLLHNEELVKPSLIYAMFSFWTAALFGLIVKKRYYHKYWA
ncbi:MAG: bile acid:sodium symporter family protein [Bacteroidetes bacterium]|nr:bile acid:sodium symporter family protein [Bacteroidota bacterium]